LCRVAAFEQVYCDEHRHGSMLRASSPSFVRILNTFAVTEQLAESVEKLRPSRALFTLDSLIRQSWHRLEVPSALLDMFRILRPKRP